MSYNQIESNIIFSQTQALLVAGSLEVLGGETGLLFAAAMRPPFPWPGSD